MFVGGPQRLFLANLAQFHDQIGNLRDGSEDAIHQARVAIRRLREPLALVRAGYDDDHVDALDKRVNRVFKALGRARDADIALRLVDDVQTRFALAPAALGYLRSAISRSQSEARRNLIRTLESTEAPTLAAAFESARHRDMWRFLSRNPWRDHLRSHIRSRAADVLQAANHAGGVYFRNRSHSARVAIKQFRYAVELANALGVPTPSTGLKALRKAQNALGEAHDRQVLIDRLLELSEDDDVLPRREVALVEQFLEGEITGFHQKYMLVRAEIVQVSQACVEPPRRRLPMRAGAMAVAALAIGTVVRYRKNTPA